MKKIDLGDLNIKASVYMSKKREEAESKAYKSCFFFIFFFLGKLPVNCSFVLIDSLDSFA